MNASFSKFRFFAAALLAANLLLASGCWFATGMAVGAAGAATGMAYADGELSSNVSSKYETTVAAVKKAFAQLEFPAPTEQKDALTDAMITHTAKGDTVKVTVTRVTDDLTKVSVRIGTFGDQELSMTILDKIKANL